MQGSICKGNFCFINWIIWKYPQIMDGSETYWVVWFSKCFDIILAQMLLNLANLGTERLKHIQ